VKNKYIIEAAKKRMEKVMSILDEVENEKEYLISVRRYLHQNPEISLHEFETAEFIEKQLDLFGIEHKRVWKTGVLGTINGRNSKKPGVLGTNIGRNIKKTVLLRADIDALPITEETNLSFKSKNQGVMHACGHDLHTTALLGAAKILQALSNTYDGKILLVFQHAEEFGHGSQFFVAENITKEADRAFGIHAAPNFPVGTIAMTRGADAASCDYFKISVKGKSAHISKPYQGIDALHIASLIVTELKTLVQNLLDPIETALIGVGKIAAGNAYNIIAGDAMLEGTTRTFSRETQKLLKEKIIEIASRVAQNHGGTAITEFETFTSALINDDTAFDEAYTVAEDIVGATNIITDTSAIRGLGSDDFAEYIQDTKGVYVHIGTSNSNTPTTKYPLHNCKFDIDEQSIAIASSLYIKYALLILKKGEI